MVITKVLAHFYKFCPPYKILSPLVISFSFSLSQPVPLSIFFFPTLSLVTGLKHDKIKFHEFFCVCNFFSFSPVTLSLSPTPVSLPISLSPTPVCLSFSLPSLSLFLFFSPAPVSLSIFLSPIPVVSLSYSHSCLPVYLSLTSVSPPSLWLSLSLPPPVSLPIFLSPTMPLFFCDSLSLSPAPVSLSLKQFYLSFYLLYHIIII